MQNSVGDSSTVDLRSLYGDMPWHYLIPSDSSDSGSDSFAKLNSGDWFAPQTQTVLPKCFLPLLNFLSTRTSFR